MATKIKSININAFRGIPELDINPDGKNMLLYGENGMGKSSIIDAIEFFFTGEITPLEGVQGLSLQKHGPHLNFNPDDINIKMAFNPGNVVLNRTYSTAPNPTTSLNEYFEIAQKGTFILRRSQLLEFINSKPRERFKSIANIIGLQSLDEIELSMQRVRDELKGRRNSEEDNYRELLTQISNLTGKDIIDEGNVIQALNEKLVEEGQATINSFKDVTQHSENLMKNVKNKDIDKISIFAEIIEETKIPLTDDHFLEYIITFNDKIAFLLDKQIKEKLSIRSLLEIGRNTISNAQLDTCPLCEQPIDRELLLFEIDKRLETIENLSNVASEIRSRSSEIITELERLVSKLNIISRKIRLLPEMSNYYGELSKRIECINNLKNSIRLAAEFKNEIKIEQIIEQINTTNQFWMAIFEYSSKIFDSIELNSEEKKTLNSITLIGQVKLKNDDILRGKNQLKHYNDRYVIAEKLYSTFSETKKAKVQEIYDSIQKEINEFYSILHPNDFHTDITLQVVKRASTNLKMKPFNRDEQDPRALISEGHLDSLGICIFLAFVKKFNNNCSLLILDDVVTTIDSHHRKKICELLHNQFNDYQLIITTHDQIWYEQLRATQRAYGSAGSWKNITLDNWSLENGPIINQHKPKWEKIQEKLSNYDKEGAGSASRYYLEWILKEASNNTETNVKYKHSGLYTVGELFTPLKNRMNKLLLNGEFKDSYSKVILKLESTSFMGNLLSHDNPYAGNFSQSEVKDFCESVHLLHEIFQCPECGNFIKYYPDLKQLRCPNPKCETPFEEATK
ncbi:AAA family ATPase [Methanococcoides methylutens]|uniref:Recombination protein F n=1 Tax=Methanococcoides methylutens MM1 TaxID=1434104 RepID=A0A0E3SS78_METMT|nr:AAA family ATPase [Methanococcoides methylutens]AKB85996.1 recombination protein F [Methanococcoides methylutens MM1]